MRLERGDLAGVSDQVLDAPTLALRLEGAERRSRPTVTRCGRPPEPSRRRRRGSCRCDRRHGGHPDGRHDPDRGPGRLGSPTRATEAGAHPRRGHGPRPGNCSTQGFTAARPSLYTHCPKRPGLAVEGRTCMTRAGTRQPTDGRRVPTNRWDDPNPDEDDSAPGHSGQGARRSRCPRGPPGPAAHPASVVSPPGRS
jgi:hypothetical protein